MINYHSKQLFICAICTPKFAIRTQPKIMLPKSLLVILGIVLVIEGIPWFLSPRNTKRMLSELFQMKEQSLRLLGLFFMLAGLLFVYLGKN